MIRYIWILALLPAALLAQDCKPTTGSWLPENDNTPCTPGISKTIFPIASFPDGYHDNRMSMTGFGKCGGVSYSCRYGALIRNGGPNRGASRIH